MVLSAYMDLRDDQGQIEFTAYRCTICGEVIRPVILRNRIAERPNLLHGTKQRRFGQAITAPLRRAGPGRRSTGRGGSKPTPQGSARP